MFRKEQVKKEAWRSGFQSCPVIAVKKGLPHPEGLNSRAAAGQLGAADCWTESVEEHLSSRGQLLCPEACSDSTRLRIDYQRGSSMGSSEADFSQVVCTVLKPCTAGTHCILY